MKTYRVFYKEVLSHVFYVDAESENEVVDRFNELVDKGRIDFSDGEVVDSDIDFFEEV